MPQLIHSNLICMKFVLKNAYIDLKNNKENDMLKMIKICLETHNINRLYNCSVHQRLLISSNITSTDDDGYCRCNCVASKSLNLNK